MNELENTRYYADKTTSRPPEIEVLESKFCKYCGRSIDADSIFCPNCGSRIEKSNGADGGQRINVNNTTVNNTTNNINYTTVNMGGAAAGTAAQSGGYAAAAQTLPVRYGKRIDKWTAFLLCLFLGPIGAHKFYEGRTGMGILYLLTGGLLGLGWLADIFIILGKSDPYYTGGK